MSPPEIGAEESALRAAIRREVTELTPCDSRERDHVNETLAWIDSGAQLCRVKKPDVPPRHLVAYFVCVDADHLLLVDHKKAQLWLPTGGHVEVGEHPRASVVREAREELGIEAEFAYPEPLLLTVTQTVGRTAGHTDVSLWYVLQLERERTLHFTAEEFHSVRWFAESGLPYTRSDPHLARFLRKLQARNALRAQHGT